MIRNNLDNSSPFFSPKIILIAFFCIGIFLYLSQKFEDPNFSVSTEQLLERKLGEKTSHTIVDMVKNNGKILAWFCSTGVGTVLFSLPVSLLNLSSILFLY